VRPLSVLLVCLSLAACGAPPPQVARGPLPPASYAAAPVTAPAPSARLDPDQALERLRTALATPIQGPRTIGAKSGKIEPVLPTYIPLYTPDYSPWSGRFPREPLEIRLPLNRQRRNDVAVVIGNADYGSRGHDLPDVIPAYVDAETFFLYAHATLGVPEENIIDLRNASLADMVRIFGNAADPHGQLADRVKPDSEVTVYYSGHGAPGPAEGEGYLLPVDADAFRLALTGYPLQQLLANLETLPVRHVTVVLEACFSGLSAGGTLVPRASGIVVTPRAPALARSKITLISAGGPDEIASWDKDGRDGLFTRHYLVGMAGAADRKGYGDGDGKVTLAELKAYLDDQLTGDAQRLYGRPQRARFYGADAPLP
jgi:hypothetical protein